MKQPNMHPKLFDFMSSLSRLEEILAQHERAGWFEKIKRVRQVTANSDGYCVELFLGLHGGMGSFNDLVLNAPNSANNELNRERSRAYQLARELLEAIL